MKNKFFVVLFSLLFLSQYLLFAQKETKSIKTTAGQIYYEVCGKGAPVLFLSGGPGAPPQSMNPIIDYISNHYKSILLHQRGTGKSENLKIDSTTINLNDYLNDVIHVLDNENIKQTYLIGHSWGAMLAMDFMTKYPEKTKGVILIGAPGATLNFMSTMNHNIISLMTKEEMDSLQTLSLQLNDETLDENSKKILFDKMSKLTLSKQFHDTSHINELLSYGNLNTDVNALMMQHLLKINWNLENELKNNTIPTIIINGRKDPIGTQTVQKLKEVIPQSLLYIIDDCGHYVWLEKPDKLKEIILSFLFECNN